MTKRILVVFLLLLGTGSISLLFGWGFWVHQRINRASVFALPDSMGVFFYNHIDYITQESQMPDVRIYAIDYKAEANRHYIDLESLDSMSVQAIPKTMKDAVNKYGDSAVQDAGLLPWYIEEITTRLTKAFREKNKPYILFHAADLAHYIGDAHVPLHTTVKHDGTSKDQKGIHSFWESELPEYFGAAYHYNTGKARYITDTKDEIWRIIESSHKLVDTVLLKEEGLRNRSDSLEMYVKDATGKIIKNRYNQRRHDREYARQYNELLNGMVEKQMHLSIEAVSNFWYTAWVNAGKPELTGLDDVSLTKRNQKFYRNEYRLWEKGKLFGLKTNTEF
jgi:hypothetical protein